MSYTQIYRDIYQQVRIEKVSHEDAHRITMSITDAISNLGLIIKDNPSNLKLEVKKKIKKTIEENRQ
jgi:hypothetical protein